MNDRFKFNKEQCAFCRFSLDIGCIAPGNYTPPLPCDPVDRLYESLKTKRSYKYLKTKIELPLHEGFV